MIATQIAPVEQDQARSAIESALAKLAPRLGGSAARVENLTLLTGGASLQTWSLDLSAPERVRRLILRRRAAGDGEVFETSLTLPVEAALLQRAHAAGVPVAALIRDCEPADDLGEAIIVSRLDGETLGRKIVADPAMASGRAKLGVQLGEALAGIHGTSADGIDLETLDARATLARYEAVWRRAGTVRPTIELAFRLLDRDAPVLDTPVLVHGDFRNGNLMVDAAAGLVGVLDWELAHLGDPAEDFGWLCVNSWRFGAGDFQAGGVATLDAVLDAYAAQGRAVPDRKRIRYWQMMGSLKWAVITQMMYLTYAAQGDAGRLERAVIGRRLSECEVDLLALAKDWA